MSDKRPAGTTYNFNIKAPRDVLDSPRNVREEIEDRLRAIDRKITLHQKEAKASQAKAREELAEIARLEAIRAGYQALIERA